MIKPIIGIVCGSPRDFRATFLRHTGMDLDSKDIRKRYVETERVIYHLISGTKDLLGKRYDMIFIDESYWRVNGDRSIEEEIPYRFRANP